MTAQTETSSQSVNGLHILNSQLPPPNSVYHRPSQLPVLCLVSQLCPTRRAYGLFPARTLCPLGFSRQEYWSGLPCPPSRGSSQPRDGTQVSCIAGTFFTIWAPREAQEYQSWYPIPSPGDLPDLGIQPESPALQADSVTSWATREAPQLPALPFKNKHLPNLLF